MNRLRLAFVALVAAVVLAACGSSAGLIPQTSANALRLDLTNVDNSYASHDCASARAELNQAETDFVDLLTGVNGKLARQLQAGLATLTADEKSQCHAASSGSGSHNNGSTAGSGATGTTGTTSTSSTTSTTTSSTTTSSTTSSAATTTGGPTGPTCVTTTNPNGGTPICVGTTSPTSGIGGAGNGVGATGTGAASVGN
jgi:hypothetical protein